MTSLGGAPTFKKKKREIRRCEFTASTTRHIRKFHIIIVNTALQLYQQEHKVTSDNQSDLKTKRCSGRQARERVRDQIMIDFGITFDWLG